eukprot:1500377-Amphidinium_carterae.1
MVESQFLCFCVFVQVVSLFTPTWFCPPTAIHVTRAWAAWPHPGSPGAKLTLATTCAHTTT